MGITVLLEAAGISAVVSVVVSFITIRLLNNEKGFLSPPGAGRQKKTMMPPLDPPPKQVPRKVKEKERNRNLEYESPPEHCTVLRKIASDMKSQLKGYTDSASRVPVPVTIPEISTMALWTDLIRNHYHEDDFDFEANWYRFTELMRDHSRMESNMFIDIEALIKERLVGYSALNNDNVSIAPPENTVYYNSELVASIMRNWLDSMRGNELHYSLDNGTDLGMEDAKKQLKIPDARFLTLYNRKIASGAEVMVESLENIVRDLLLNFHEVNLFVKYRSNLTENEAEVDALRTRLEEILSRLESTSVFRGMCPYSR